MFGASLRRGLQLLDAVDGAFDGTRRSPDVNDPEGGQVGVDGADPFWSGWSRHRAGP